MGCEKEDPKTLYGTGAIYIDNEIYKELGTISCGGSTSNPDEGHTHFCRMFEGVYSRFGLHEAEPIVRTFGYVYLDRTYPDFAEVLKEIRLYGLPGIGDLKIGLNQGKYEGGNEQVSSVDIKEYFLGKKDNIGNTIELGRIDIEIILKEGRKINICYTGQLLADILC